MTSGPSYFRRDDCGHWYLVPEQDVARFDELMEVMSEMGDEVGLSNECMEFNQRFHSMMVGSPEDYKVIVHYED